MVYSLQIPTGWKKTINISPDKRKAREHIDSEHTSVDWPKQFSCTEWKHKRWSRRDGRWVRKRMNLRREASLCEKLFESWDKVETLCVASSSIAFLLWQFGQQHGKPWEPVLRAEGSRLCPARFCWALSVCLWCLQQSVFTFKFWRQQRTGAISYIVLGVAWNICQVITMQHSIV